MSLKRGNKRVEDFEWITNRDLVDSAQYVLGGIDLDPASSNTANEYVGAKEIYTIKDDGLNEIRRIANVRKFGPCGCAITYLALTCVCFTAHLAVFKHWHSAQGMTRPMFIRL